MTMKKLYSFFISTLLVSSAVCAGGTDYTKGLAIWFDAPNTLQGHAVWYGGRPDMWKGENKPETAGDTARNPDAAWESQSLPIGNGSIGANIMGSVEAERITFNEKHSGGVVLTQRKERITTGMSINSQRISLMKYVKHLRKETKLKRRG